MDGVAIATPKTALSNGCCCGAVCDRNGAARHDLAGDRRNHAADVCAARLGKHLLDQQWAGDRLCALSSIAAFAAFAKGRIPGKILLAVIWLHSTLKTTLEK